LHAWRILLRENSFYAEDDSKISALRILKIGAKSRQDRRKILYEAGKRKEREFFAKFTTKFRRQKLVQGCPKPAQRPKSRRKILAPKFRPQISPGRSALDGAGFELAANFYELNFTQKSALDLQNLS